MNVSSLIDRQDWLLILGVLLSPVGIFWAVFFGLRVGNPPLFDELTQVEGIVQDINFVMLPDAVRQVRILLGTKNETVRIQARIPSSEKAKVYGINDGDKVLVWIIKDNMWRDFYWVWQMERSNESIFSYQQLAEPALARCEKMTVVGIIMTCLGISFIGASMIKTYGSMRSGLS